MVDFIQRLNVIFTDADKETCLPVIEKIVDMATAARSKGLLALEDEVKSEEDFFFKTAIMLIVDNNDRAYVRETLQFLILSGNHSGAELLSRLIVTDGVMWIAMGSNPRLIREKLAMMLGEKYHIRMEKEQEEKQKAESEKAKIRTLEQFYENTKERNKHSQFGALEWIMFRVKKDALQAILNSFDIKYLAAAMEELSHKAIQMVMEMLNESKHQYVFDNWKITYNREIDSWRALDKLYVAVTGDELSKDSDYIEI